MAAIFKYGNLTAVALLIDYHSMADPKPITIESLADLVRAGSVRTIHVVQTGDRWAVEADVGMERRPMRSQRSDVRLFASLDTLSRFLRERIGISRFEVVGQ